LISQYFSIKGTGLDKDRVPPADQSTTAASANGSANGAAPHCDPDASTAFALGWELASIHALDQRTDHPSSPSAGASVRTRLPTVETLSNRTRLELSILLVESNLGKLMGRLPAGQRAFDCQIIGLRHAIKGKASSKPEEKIKALHAQFLIGLLTAGPKLGHAYALGHELAEITLWPKSRHDFDDAFGTRAIAIKDRLADLTSSFPEHAGRAVVLSLRAWEKWAAEPELNGDELKWDKWDRAGEAVTTALKRQGVLWRDLLTGDKRGQDMLDAQHYIQAASSLFARMFRTTVSFGRKIWWLILIFVVLLLGGIALILFAEAKFLGSVLAALGALGITGGSVRARLRGVADELQAELWGAEMDRAIADAVLTGPSGWGVKIADIDVPASGAELVAATNITKLHEFARVVKKRSRTKIRKLLAADVEFVPDPGEEAMRGEERILSWLMSDLNTGQITAEPEKIEVLKQGILVSDDGERGGAVWRIREGKVRRWKSFPTFEQAKADANRLVGAPVGLAGNHG
jgi:hypothetical protein